MALTGLQIQKLLPKTNCKECGSNTCLAFAMKLAAKKAELAACPYASEEAKAILGAAAEPPVRSVALGPDRSIRLGAETVLYRHEKTFVNQTALAVNVNDTDAAADINATLKNVGDYVLTRVGQDLRIDLVAVTQKGSDASSFVALAQKAWKETGKPLVLRSPDPKALAVAAEAVKGSGSVLCPLPIAPGSPAMGNGQWAIGNTEATIVALIAAAKNSGHALAITAPDLDQLASLAESIRKSGFDQLILQLQTHSLAEQFQTSSIARRAALKDAFKPLGYPTLRFIESVDALDATVEAITEINKYGGICVFPSFDAAQIASMMTLRLNIYTDPQKPIQVEPRVYPVGEPTPDSPIFVTTNFSLTYFIVSGEIENSGTSGWLVVPECEGLSVLTAWAAGKFSGSSIAKFVKEVGLESQVRQRQIIIPGYVAQISGELEENLPGWQVVVGPQEAGDLEGFVKARNSGR